jgi:ComF family protein
MPVLERLISTVAPHLCLGCRAEGDIVCKWCLPEVVEPLPSRCYRCKKISNGWLVCESCRKASRLSHVWVCTEYGSIAKKLVQKFKFERARAAARPMAELMAETLPFFDRNILVVHVPTSTRRQRQRGYDQAELLAREIAQQINKPHKAALARHGHSRQVGASRSERLEQLNEAFRVKNQKLVQNAHILLVDDITTTGATLETAAQVLRQNGARQIDAVVFAQK